MDYGFFDYKYNIAGYAGQDFDNGMRYVYMVFCLVMIPLLVFLFRKADRKRVTYTLRALSIFMIVLDVTKIVWESYWDITTGQGFNFGGLLPLDTCSIFLFVLPVAAFGKGKLQEYSLAWLVTFGFVGGFANVLFIQGLKWYPFWTFGAMYSMIYHFVMVFTALWIVATLYLKVKPKHILYALVPHGIFSLIAIPLNYVFGWDYMLYRRAGGVPAVEGISDKLIESGLPWVTPLIMIAVYVSLDAAFIGLYILWQKAVGAIRSRKASS